MSRQRNSGRRSEVTPREYEEQVAAHFRQQGYSVELTPSHNDYGVDVFACKGNQKLAIQAKMYGGTARRVNREMVMQLHGAKDYFDCTGAVIVTDGEVAESAKQVAAKLGIETLSLTARVRQHLDAAPQSEPEAPRLSSGDGSLSFEQVWERYVIPLAGQTLVGEKGRTNKIMRVDWSGVQRTTSSGKEQFIAIEIFRQAVNQILAHGCVARSEINENYAKRASSGVILILSQVPHFEVQSSPIRLVLRSQGI